MSFDQEALNWDNEMRVNRAKAVAEKIKSTLDKPHYNKALEFGCGTGLISFNLLDLFDQMILHDISEGMLDVVKKKTKMYSVDKITCSSVDLLTDMNPEIRDVDVIYSSLVLHHIEDTKGVLHKLHETLNKGGELCFVDINEDNGRFHLKYPDYDGHNGFNHETLKMNLESVGFKNVQIETFYNGVKEHNGDRIEYSMFIAKGTK